MPRLGSFTQTHLSVLVIDRDTQAPIVRMPVYAEVSLVVDTPPRPLDLGDVGDLDEFRHPVLGPMLAEALARATDDETYQGLSPERRRELLRTVAELVRERGLVGLGDEARRIEAGEVVAEALQRLGIAPQHRGSTTTYSYPLGTLATDHAGYVSFDLRRLNGGLPVGRGNATHAFHVYPMAKESARYDALQQARFTREAIFAKLELAAIDLSQMSLLNLPSMQNPDLVDWYLSPGSFAVTPDLLIGEDGCEKLVVAPIVLQEFGFRQVVRLRDVPAGIQLPGNVRFGYVDEYHAGWFALGHSLGEIQYSLPLAPGESVKLAVVDWAWEGESARREETELEEQVLHRTHRDRVINETVQATVDEWQRGGTVMGGLAASGGVGGAAGALGVAGGASAALGGTYSTSSGSRDLAAENVQRLSDSFVQASSGRRELNSTVVIQSRQAEKETIQTRTFTNYNHSHTLTILYYEVLRHYRVETRWVRRRPVALIQPAQLALDPAKAETRELVRSHRPALERFLLDQRVRPGFDAVEKLLTVTAEREAANLDPLVDREQPQPGRERDMLFKMFEFVVRTNDGLHDEMGNEADSDLTIDVVRWDGFHIRLVTGPEPGARGDDFNSGGRVRGGGEWASFFAYVPDWYESPVDAKTPPTMRAIGLKWGDIAGFEISTARDTWRLHSMAIHGFAMNNGPKIIVSELKEYHRHFGYYRTEDDDDNGNNTFTEIRPPAADPPFVPPIPSAEHALSVEERLAMRRLLEHLHEHTAYYSNAVALARHPNEVAIDFEQLNWLGNTDKAIDHIEPKPLDVFGSYVAYPLIGVPDVPVDPQARGERLVTFPTRGVFAEGKLGHCNISEEIDNTRYWQWEQHPIPVEAPGINPATPVTPKPEAPTTGTTPTTFPAPIITIAQPTAAPDPHGIAGALTALTASNIFRDMSGRAEIADLLKKLSDNSISIAQAGEKAKEIQNKAAADAATAQNTREVAALKALTDAKTPVQEAAAQRTLESASRSAELEGDLARLQASGAMLSPSEQAKVRDEIVKKWTTPQPDKIQLAFHHSHAASGERLDGEFDAVFTGTVGGLAVVERVPYTTNVGVAMVDVALAPGQYTLAIQGRRAKFPATVQTRLAVPAVGAHPALDVDLAKTVAPLRATLSGQLATITIPAAAKRVIVTVTAAEQTATGDAVVDFTKPTPDQQAATALTTLLKDSDLSALKLDQAVADGADKVKLTVTYGYLTKALTITAA